MRSHTAPAGRRFGAALLAASLVASGGLALGASAANAADNIDSGDLQLTHELNQGWRGLELENYPDNDGFGQWPVAKNVAVDGQTAVAIGDPQSFWNGGSWTTPAGNPWGYALAATATPAIHPQILASVNPIADPSCTATEVKITATATLINRGPTNSGGVSARAALVNDGVGVSDAAPVVKALSNVPVDSPRTVTLEATVPLADLQGGKIDVAIGAETMQDGNRAWEFTAFDATYDVLCDPTATPVEQTVLPSGPTDIDLTGHVTTDLVDPDWSTLKLTGENGQPVDTLTRPEGTYTVQPGGQVRFEPNPDFTGGPVGQPVAFTVKDGNGKETGNNITLTVARPPLAENLPAETETTTPVTVDPVAEAEGRDGAAIDPASVRFVVEGNLVEGPLTIPGKGSFTIDPTTGRITFQAVEGFTGEVEARYSIADSRGLRTERAVTVDVAAAPVKTEPKISVPSKVPATDFIDPEKGATIEVTGCAPGETVTYRVSPKGNPNVVSYTGTEIADADGNSAHRVHGTGSDAAVYVGDYDVTVTCGDVTLTDSFTVTGNGDKNDDNGKDDRKNDKGTGSLSGSKGDLATTGASGQSGLLIGGAVALLLAGSAAVFAAVRRRRLDV